MFSVSFRRAVIALALIAAPTVGLAAAKEAPPPPFNQVGDAVPGHGTVTWFDLIRQAVPDLATDAASDKATGHLTKPPRHLAGADYLAEAPDPVEVGLIESQRIKAGGRSRLLVLFDLGQAQDNVASYTVLALFDDAPTPRLLDMVDVGLDRDTSFSEQSRLKLGPGDDGFVTYSEHFNTSAAYGGWLVGFVRGDKLKLAFSLFGLNTRECGWQRTETPTFTGRSVKGRSLGDIDLVVREQRTQDLEPHCDSRPPRPFVRTWRATYRWDAAKGRFVTDSKALEQLAKRDEGRR